VATVLGVFLPFLDYGYGTDQLVDDKWMAFWLIGLVPVAGYALLRLVNERPPSDVAAGIVIGIAPTVVPFAPWILAFAFESDEGSPGMGLVLFMAGLVALTAAGVVLAARTPRGSTPPPGWTPTSVAWTAGAAVVGVIIAMAWSDVTVRHYRHSLDVPDDHVWNLVLQLLMVTLGLCALLRWPGRRISRARLLPAAGVVSTGVILAFVDGADPATGAAVCFLVAYALLALTAIAVPVLATAFRPDRRAAVILAAWAVESISIWLDTAFADQQQSAGVILNLALLATAVLAVAGIHARRTAGVGPAGARS
jgi:hypothetical protein